MADVSCGASTSPLCHALMMAGEGMPLSAGAGDPAALDPDGTAAGPPAIGASEAAFATGRDDGGAAAPSPRASDAERNAVVGRLSKATGEGRITLEEFADAAGAAYASVTVAELDSVLGAFGLLGHLPPPPRSSPAEVAAGAPRREGSTGATSVDNVIAVMSGTERKGRWKVGRRTRAVAFMGAVNLDLRTAVIDADVVEIDACALMGGVTITVPEGIPVEMSGFVIMGGRTSRIADRPVLPGAPTIRVRAAGMWGGVHVRSRPARKAGAHGNSGHRGSNRKPADRELRARTVPSSGRPSGDLLTIVCTDIVGSTPRAVSLGDQRWHALLSAHNALVRGHLAYYGGREVKTSGDGFIVVFTSARAALNFAVTLQEEIRHDPVLQADGPFSVRIGVHAGEVERDGPDVVGRNVTMACRLCDVAGPGEVLASSVVADLTDSASDLIFGTARTHSLSGMDRPVPAVVVTGA